MVGLVAVASSVSSRWREERRAFVFAEYPDFVIHDDANRASLSPRPTASNNSSSSRSSSSSSSSGSSTSSSTRGGSSSKGEFESSNEDDEGIFSLLCGRGKRYKT